MRTDDPDFIRSASIMMYVGEFKSTKTEPLPYGEKFIEWLKNFNGTIQEAWEQADQLYQCVGLLQTINLKRDTFTSCPYLDKPTGYFCLIHLGTIIAMFEHIIRLIKETASVRQHQHKEWQTELDTTDGLILTLLKETETKVTHHKKSYNLIHRGSHIYSAEKEFMDTVCMLIPQQDQQKYIDIMRSYVAKLYFVTDNPTPTDNT